MVEFNNILIDFSSEEFRLKGVISLPKNVLNPPIVIGCHGLLGSSRSKKQVALAKRCISLGIAFFRFDHRGCGKSDGHPIDGTSFDGRCCDVIEALKVVKHIGKTGSIGLFGSSLGGAVALSVALKLKTTPVITCATPIRSASIQKEAIIKAFLTDKNIFLKSRNHKSLMKNLNSSILPEQQNMLNVKTVNKFKLNLYFNLSKKISSLSNILLFHGTADEIVPITDLFDIFSKVKKNKKMIIQHKGDHNMSRRSHQEDFIKKSGDWYYRMFKRHTC